MEVTSSIHQGAMAIMEKAKAGTKLTFLATSGRGEILIRLEGLPFHLWHGKVFKALGEGSKGISCNGQRNAALFFLVVGMLIGVGK